MATCAFIAPWFLYLQAIAQTTQGSAPAGTSATNDTSSGLAEIVVTAQRREENLQRVPIAVSAVSGTDALKLGITDPQDLTTLVPGLMVQTQAAQVQIYMRGVGTDATQAGTENAVATFIDGVYVPSMMALFMSFNNVSQIEVLKGPQGTLYGRNAVAGVINVITKDPTSDPHLEASIGYGNYQTTQGSFYGSTALAPNVNFGLAAVYDNQAKGAGINIYNGDGVNKGADLGLSGKLLLTPAEDLKISFLNLYDHHTGSYGLAYRNANDGSRTIDGATSFSHNFYDVDDNIQPESVSVFYLTALHVDYNLGPAKVASITAYQDVNKGYQYDSDGTAVADINVNFNQFERTFSQEFHLSSPDSADILTWLAGLYYFHDESGYDPFGLSGAGLGPIVLSKEATQDTASYAVFGQATYQFLPKTNLTIGLRYTSDHREALAVDNTNLGLLDPALRESNSVGKPTWRIALDHRFEDETMIYGSYNRGFKSGEYNLAAFPSTGTTVVKPETLDDFELGVKSQLFDNRLRLNADAFYYIYKNMQFSAYEGTEDLLLNAASSRIYGLDLDFQAALITNLSISGGLEALHATFTSFPTAPITTEPQLGNIEMPGDAAGNDLEKAPPVVVNTAINYRVPLATAGALESSVIYYFNDGFFWAPDNRVRQPSYSLVNVSFGWVDPSSRYRVTLWANNLFGKEYFTQLTEQLGLGDTAVAGAPRTFGIRFGISL